MGTSSETGYDPSKDESIKLVVPDYGEQPPSQGAVDKAVFDHNTAVAKAQLEADKKRGARIAIVPDPSAEEVLERSARFNIEPAVAKAQLDANMIVTADPIAGIIEDTTKTKPKAG